MFFKNSASTRSGNLTFQTVTFLLGLAFAVTAMGRSAQAIETIGKQVIMIDMTTGATLFEKNADELMPPSSMSKMMTLYLVFARLKEARLSLDDVLSVSKKAWRKGGSKMFVKVNTRVRVEDLIRGIAIQSGNDACIVVAEGLAGSEDAFAREMTDTARAMGMSNSTFKNASGWPDPQHLTTARDLAILARSTVQNFPDYYRYYSEKTFTYSGIKQSNRNPLVYGFRGGDGIKTGHTEAAGYGLTATAERNGRRLILVINGLPSAKARKTESERLLDWGFREYANYTLLSPGQTITRAPVWLGAMAKVPLISQDGVLLTMPRKARAKMRVTVRYNSPISAPIAKGQPVAQMVVKAPGFETQTFPLVAGEDIARLGLIGRLGAALKFILWGAAG